MENSNPANEELRRPVCVKIIDGLLKTGNPVTTQEIYDDLESRYKWAHDYNPAAINDRNILKKYKDYKYSCSQVYGTILKSSVRHLKDILKKQGKLDVLMVSNSEQDKKQKVYQYREPGFSIYNQSTTQISQEERAFMILSGLFNRNINAIPESTSIRETFNRINSSIMEMYKTAWKSYVMKIVDEVLELYKSRPADWLSRCTSTLDVALAQFDQDQAPVEYSELLAFHAKFLGKLGSYKDLKQSGIDCDQWLRTIKQSYEKSMSIAGQYGAYRLEAQYALDFAIFLYNNRQYHEINELYDKSIRFFESIAEIDEKDLHLYADALYASALYHEELNELDKAVSEYTKALEIRRQLASKNATSYQKDVAKTLNNLGNLYKTVFNFSVAKSMMEEAYDIYDHMGAGAGTSNMAVVLRNLALVYSLTNAGEKALEAFYRSAAIIEGMMNESTGEYMADYAYLMLDIATILCMQNAFDEAMQRYSRALQIFEDLSSSNPKAYLSNVAWTHNIFVIFHRNECLYNKDAVSKHSHALEMYRELAHNNPSAYESSIARSLNLLAHAQMNSGEILAAEQLNAEALSIYRRLAEDNPSKYEGNVAWTLNMLAQTHNALGQVMKAQEENREAMDLYRKLADKAPEFFESCYSWAARTLTCPDYDSHTPLEYYVADMQRRTRRHIL